MRASTSALVQPWLARVFAILVLASTAALVSASSAQAGKSLFCPNTYEGDYRRVDANSQCISAGFISIKAVRFVAATNGVSHCAVGKANTDGSGGNITDVACGSGNWVTTGCYPATSGSAKGINREPTWRNFQGAAWWGTSCP